VTDALVGGAAADTGCGGGVDDGWQLRRPNAERILAEFQAAAMA
jgi:hypothetical protein